MTGCGRAMTGSPLVTENPAVGIAALNEIGASGHPLATRAMTSHGEERRAPILSRTCPQRQPPSQGMSSRS